MSMIPDGVQPPSVNTASNLGHTTDTLLVIPGAHIGFNLGGGAGGHLPPPWTFFAPPLKIW